MEISILIVDDDKILVDKLEETVQWEKIGISIVFTAYNIRQAQKILEEFPVQMMLCDIDMPQGSGLELLEWMRSKEMDTECIFLSSYANFAYAQKALSFSSREYLLKPISNQELEQVLQKIAEEVRKKKDPEGLQGRDFHKETFWERFLLETSEINDTEKVDDIRKIYESDETFYLQIVKMYIKDKDLERRKKCTLCKLAMSKVDAEAIVSTADNQWVMAMKPERDVSDREKAQKLATCLNEKVCLPISVYVGKTCTAKELYRAWESLKKIEREELPRKNSVLMEAEVRHNHIHEKPPWEIWQKMMTTSQGVQSVLAAVKEYLQHAFDGGNLTVKGLRQFMRELNQFLFIYMADQKLNFNQTFDANEFELREAEAYIFYEDCIEFVEFLFRTLAGHLNYDQDDAIEHVKEYIDKNLSKELSRSILANEVFLSEDYISKLFKSKTGVSLTNYIAMKRVEKAKEYLEYSNLSVSKIALEVGFNNFSYFSKTFKDITSMTPNEYKNSNKKNAK